MKKLLKKLCIVTFICSCMMILFMNVILASNLAYLPLRYNIIATVKSESIIDTNHQKDLTFSLFTETDIIYYQGKPVSIENDQFKIDITNLTGYQTIQFTNDQNESVSFSYYFADKNGKVDEYELVKNKKLNVYVTTEQEIKMIYTDKEKKVIQKVKDDLKVLPTSLLENVDTFIFIPYSNTSNIAGTTKNKTVTFYQFSKYAINTQKNILYHEIAHTWASKLMQKKVIDYSYTEYQKAVGLDKNAVSSYSQKFLNENGKYSEDFADSVAFYFINQKSFMKKYPNRAAYLQQLLEK